MSTADKLNKLITTKAAIKEAIQNKGVTVTDTDTFASYADKISSISSGGGGYEFDFTVLGYNQEECKDANDIANAAITLGDYTQSQITEAIAYGKQLYDGNYSINGANVDRNKLLFYPKLELPHMYKDSKVLYIPNVEYSSTGSYVAGSAYTNYFLYKVGSINAVFTNSHYSAGFFNNCYSLREVGDINITGSKIINYNNFFQNCYALRKIGNLNTTGSTTFENMFANCISLTSIHQLDTSSGTTFNNMFNNCSSLTAIPQLNTSKGTTFNNMLYNCTCDVNGLDFSNAEGKQNYQKPFYYYKGKRVSNIKTTKYSAQFFSGCSNLESATNIDPSASTDHSLNNMFQNCPKLKEVSFTSTSNITNFSNMFSSCASLTSISQLDTSSGTNFNNIFASCYSLTSIPQLNTSRGTNFNNMFSQCTSITTIPQIDVSSGTTFNGMFSSCDSLTSLPQLDTSSGTSLENMFSQSTDLKRIEGISLKSLDKTVGYNYLTGTLSMPKLRYALIKDIGTCTGMTSASFIYWTLWGVDDETTTDARQSLIDSLLTYSFDRATAGYSTCTISLHDNTKALLTEDEIAQITAKGYTIA